MSEFKVFRIHKSDGKVSGQIETSSLNDLDAGEVVIRSVYSSVNYKDALAGTGMGKIIRNFPCIGGIDVSGYVESSTDERYPVGLPVIVTGYELGVGHDGGYAEFVRVPAEWVVPLPDGLSLFEAMVLGTAGFTVALSVKRLLENGLSPEQGPILVTGATGGVGSLAIDIFSTLGYDVVAVTGKDTSSDFLSSIGASEILDRNQIDFSGPPLEAGRWAGAVDNVGGDMLAWLTRTMNPWGNIVSIGLAGGSHLNTTVMPFILRGVGILGVSSSGCPTSWRNQLWQQLATDWHPSHLETITSRQVSLEQLPEVFSDMLKGQVQGRTVVSIGEE